MLNNPPDDWADRSYGEKEAWRQGSRTRHARDENAWGRLDTGTNVKTPDGWVDFIAKKQPNDTHIYVESWDQGGVYRASQVEPVDGEFA